MIPRVIYCSFKQYLYPICFAIYSSLLYQGRLLLFIVGSHHLRQAKVNEKMLGTPLLQLTITQRATHPLGP
jgi:hypothetical protein